MSDQIKNIAIGIFVVAGLGIIIFMLMFLHPSTGDRGQVLYVRFADIDKINIGTRVTYAGKAVGEVVGIREVPEERTADKMPDKYIYIYELKLLIDSNIKIYNTDEITARTSGLLGEKSVALIPLEPQPGQVLIRLGANDIIYATPTGSVEDTMKEFKEVADKFELALDSVTIMAQEFNDLKIWQKVSTITQNLSDITTALNQPEEWHAILSNMTDLTAEALNSWKTVDATLNDFSIVATNAKKISEEGLSIAANLNSISHNSNQIISYATSGQGSVGKLFIDDDLYLRLTSLLNKGDTVVNDINHYGLLFQLDKGWQRMRARQANLVQRLATPQQFRNYFNNEIDKISTSLSRVNMVMNKSEMTCPRYLAENREFTKVFAELLRRVEGVESSLKLYDQQLMESNVLQTELIENCCHY